MRSETQQETEARQGSLSLPPTQKKLPVHGFVFGHPPSGVSLLVLADGVVVVVVVIVFHTVFVAA